LGDERYTFLEYLSKESPRLREAHFRAIAEELKGKLDRMRGKGE
jgi:hypothetical protein